MAQAMRRASAGSAALGAWLLRITGAWQESLTKPRRLASEPGSTRGTGYYETGGDSSTRTRSRPDTQRACPAPSARGRGDRALPAGRDRSPSRPGRACDVVDLEAGAHL